MKSLTYYLTLIVIKIAGVKKKFNKDPLDYLKLRQDDVHRPTRKIFNSNSYRKIALENFIVTEIQPPHANNNLVIFCHGGAFVYGPVAYHWTSAVNIVSQTKTTLWMVDYPKAPEADIQIISSTVDEVYKIALKNHPLKKVVFIGDSAGGTLLTALTQRLVLKQGKLPTLLILISPVFDASFSNPEINHLEKKDPILARKGVLSAKRMAASKMSLKHPLFSLFTAVLIFSPRHFSLLQRMTLQDQIRNWLLKKWNKKMWM